MNKRDEFLKTQKILRLCTIDKKNFPHITPVWYRYSGKKIQIGTNTKSQKIKNIEKNNNCLLYTSPSPRDKRQSRMPSSA